MLLLLLLLMYKVTTIADMAAASAAYANFPHLVVSELPVGHPAGAGGVTAAAIPAVYKVTAFADMAPTDTVR
jgi:hypothetical protein